MRVWHRESMSLAGGNRNHGFVLVDAAACYSTLCCMLPCIFTFGPTNSICFVFFFCFVLYVYIYIYMAGKPVLYTGVFQLYVLSHWSKQWRWYFQVIITRLLLLRYVSIIYDPIMTEPNIVLHHCSHFFWCLHKFGYALFLLFFPFFVTASSGQ